MTSMRDLPEDDEFAGISFSQLDEEGKSLEVKTCTYALMSWWKGLGNADTIDISDDSNLARLGLDMDLELVDDDIYRTGDVYIDVFEESSVICYCAYPHALSDLDASELQQLLPLIARINSATPFGSFELLYDNEAETGRVRYKASVCTEGVSVGKVAMVENLFIKSSVSITAGLNGLNALLRDDQS